MYHNRMKHIVSCIGSFLLLAGCVTRDSGHDTHELLPDSTFAQWFTIRGLGQPWDDGDSQGVFRTTPEKVGAPVWTLAQWASVPSLADTAVTRQTQLGSHRFQIENRTKRIIVDSRRGELELAIFASANYTQPRQKNEPWPHLLASVSLTDSHHPAEHCRIGIMRRLDVALKCCLTEFSDCHPNADTSLHAAQFQLFIYVQNLNIASSGYGDMLWFGVPIFDSRRTFSEECWQRDGGKPDASQKFIYIMPSVACQPQGTTFFKSDVITTDAGWTQIRADVLPWIHRAYTLARQGGYLTTTNLEDIYVSGLNFGWEMPGTYDAAMRVRGFSIRCSMQ